ncbi:eukaryotic translation initiation factor 4 gamma 1-like isoform X1 [Penaeus japonicus]|uniref:eukaryotic translation initiation factor 4 gamma 1-like isoform X1 n=2 Tax=Penaeus japonicus TaxID=27405 RepID=UPI001C70B529|nr:eukaryotic translation initiation factor 4 gamma 1-like isoform X1 [Penaeus japonicus]
MCWLSRGIMPEGPSMTIGNGSDSPPSLRRCDNPWKRNAQHGQSEVYRRMLGILNRVTEQSLTILLEQAQELPLSDPDHLPHVLALLLDKAQDEPLFAPIYARMCRDLAARVGIQDDLTAACESHFTESYNLLLQYADILEGPISSQLIHEEILARKRFIGHLKFVSELHKVGVMSSNQVVAMAETLLEHGDDRSLEGLCRLLSFSGLPLSRTNEAMIEQSCTYLENRLVDGSLSPRLRFLIQDVLDLHANGWRPRGGGRIHPPPGRNVRG